MISYLLDPVHQFKDKDGNILFGGSVSVFNWNTDELSDIYEEDGITIKENPSRIDNNGRWSFKADDGYTYRLEVRDIHDKLQYTCKLDKEGIVSTETFGEFKNEVLSSLSSKMDLSALEYDDDGKISAYNGSAFAGQGGDVYSAGENIDITNKVISVTDKVEVYVDDTMTISSTEVEGKKAVVLGVNDNEYVKSESFETTVEEINDKIDNKEDRINFEYKEGKIVSINGSGVSAGSNYEQGANINITNNVISGRDWNEEITNATEGMATRQDLSASEATLRSEMGNYQPTSEMTAYALKTDVNNKLDTTSFNDTLTRINKTLNSLHDEDVALSSVKMDVSSFDTQISSYALKSEIPSTDSFATKEYVDSSISGKQDKLSDYTPNVWNDVSSKADKNWVSGELDNKASTNGYFMDLQVGSADFATMAEADSNGRILTAWYATNDDVESAIKKSVSGKQDKLSDTQLSNIDNALTSTNGLAQEGKFEISNNKITAYNGTAFAGQGGQGGKTYTSNTPNWLEVDNTNDKIGLTESAISTLSSIPSGENYTLVGGNNIIFNTNDDTKEITIDVEVPPQPIKSFITTSYDDLSVQWVKDALASGFMPCVSLDNWLYTLNSPLTEDGKIDENSNTIRFVSTRDENNSEVCIDNYGNKWTNNWNMWDSLNVARSEFQPTTALVNENSATWNDVTNKEDKINYGYTEGLITSINGSAFSAGSNYVGINPIVVNNEAKTISAKTKKVHLNTFTHDDTLKHTDIDGTYTLSVNLEGLLGLGEI